MSRNISQIMHLKVRQLEHQQDAAQKVLRSTQGSLRAEASRTEKFRKFYAAARTQAEHLSHADADPRLRIAAAAVSVKHAVSSGRALKASEHASAQLEAKAAAQRSKLHRIEKQTEYLEKRIAAAEARESRIEDAQNADYAATIMTSMGGSGVAVHVDPKPATVMEQSVEIETVAAPHEVSQMPAPVAEQIECTWVSPEGRTVDLQVGSSAAGLYVDITPEHRLDARALRAHQVEMSGLLERHGFQVRRMQVHDQRRREQGGGPA